MKPASITAAIVLTLVAGAVLLAAGVASSQGVATPARIAFLDVAEVFKSYEKSSEIQQQVRDELRRVDQVLKVRYDDLRKRRADLDTLVPGTPEYQEKKQELDFEAFKLEYEEKAQKRGIAEKAVKKMNRVYTEIRNEAENYARRNGLHAVLMVNEQDIEARSLDELQILIASRPVIFREKSMDITQEILKILEAK